MKRLLAVVPVLFVAADLRAQSSDVEAGQLAVCACQVVFFVLYIGFWLGSALWVMKDAKRRNSPNAQLVTILTWLPPTTLVGLILHIATRPKDVANSGNNPPR